MGETLGQLVRNTQQLFRADAVRRAEATKAADPFDPASMNDASVAYCLPADGFWRLVEGTIVAESGTALVVKDARYGVEHTINPNWVVSYLWQRETPTSIDMGAL